MMMVDSPYYQFGWFLYKENNILLGQVQQMFEKGSKEVVMNFYTLGCFLYLLFLQKWQGRIYIPMICIKCDLSFVEEVLDLSTCQGYEHHFSQTLG